MLVQEAAFATDVPSDIYAFHRYTGNSASLYRTLAGSFECNSQVEPGDFTSDLQNRLRTLYAQ